MRTCALIASIVAMTAVTSGGDIQPITLPWPFSLIRVSSPTDSVVFPTSNAPSTMSVIRLIRVTVTPASPGPNDTVSVKIEAEAFSPYLVLDRTTVDKQDGDVTIDLYWSDHTPPAQPLVQNQASSLGYGIEQIPFTPVAIRVNKTYETTETLGTFTVGMHTIHVYSHGALEGEASALFQVRNPSGIFDGMFDPIDSGSLDTEPESIWSRLGVTR